MKTWNTRLHALCEADPFDSSEAEKAEIERSFAPEAVPAFKDLDWTGVYPGFWNEVSELADETSSCVLRAASAIRRATGSTALPPKS